MRKNEYEENEYLINLYESGDVQRFYQLIGNTSLLDGGFNIYKFAEIYKGKTGKEFGDEDFRECSDQKKALFDPYKSKVASLLPHRNRINL